MPGHFFFFVVLLVMACPRSYLGYESTEVAGLDDEDARQAGWG